MPLSEREQKILEEIEKNLYAEDSRFARERPRRTPSPKLGRRARLGGLIFFAGFILLIAFFVTRLLIVGLLGFGGMVTGIVLLASPVSALVNATKENAEQRGRDAKNSIGEWRDEVKKRRRSR